MIFIVENVNKLGTFLKHNWRQSPIVSALSLPKLGGRRQIIVSIVFFDSDIERRRTGTKKVF